MTRRLVKTSASRSLPERRSSLGGEQLALDIRSPRTPTPIRPRAVRGVRKPIPVRASDMDQILNSVDIERVTGRHRCTVYRWMAEGRFPAKVVRDGRPIGWLRSEVERWLHQPSRRVPVVSLAQGDPPSESATS